MAHMLAALLVRVSILAIIAFLGLDSQRLEYISYIDLWPTGDTKANMWEPQVDKFSHEKLFS